MEIDFSGPEWRKETEAPTSTAETFSPAWMVFQALRAWCDGTMGPGTAEIAVKALSEGEYFLRLKFRLRDESEGQMSGAMTLIEFGRVEDEGKS